MRLLLFCVFCFGYLFAQTNEFKFNEYQSENNPYYWKNRKPHAGYWQQDVWYKINAKLNDSSEIITGTENIKYTNNSPHVLTEIYFHLYQNAVQPNSLVNDLYNANKTPHSFGKYEAQKLGTVVNSVKINGINCQIILPTSGDRTILRIALKNNIAVGETVSIDCDFATYFDNESSIRRRMKSYVHNGYKHFNGVHWYPRISVYDQNFTWEAEPHLEKEFYGNFGQYDVNLELPNNYICEATGVNTNRNEVLPPELWKKIQIKNFVLPAFNKVPTEIIKPNGTYKTWTYHAINVHDFAFTCDPTYRVDVTMYNNVECIAICQEENASAWHPTSEFLASVIKVYSKDFGEYAYPKIVAADARDGMEYPMLTLDGGNFPDHKGLIAHEVGHNWFFGMVGTNETYRALLDEGFTQFLTAWSMNKLSPTKNTKGQRFSIAYQGYILDAMDGTDPHLNTHSDGFNSAVGHGGGYRNVYYKTATMLYNLQYVLGDSVFSLAMKNYFNQWKICHPYTDDFRKSISATAQTDLNWFFDQWLESTKSIDYKVKRVAFKKNESLVTLQRKGTMIMPLDVLIIKEDNTVSNYTIPVSNYTKPKTTLLPRWFGFDKLNTNYTFTVPGKIKEVFIDPTERLADINWLNNSNKKYLKFMLDKGNGKPFSTNVVYPIQIRPALWFNPYDNLQVGAVWHSNYAMRKHIVDAELWVNPIKTAKADWVNFALNYTQAIHKKWDLGLQSAYQSGLFMQGIQLVNQVNNTNLLIKVENLRNLNPHYYSYTNTYLPYAQSTLNNIWNQAKNNFTLQAQIKQTWKGFYSTTQGVLQIMTALPGSNYTYNGAKITLNYNQGLGKITWRNRFVLNAMQGNIAPENLLQAAGANTAEQWQNKFTRSLNGVDIQNAQAGYTNPLNVHLAGGLNLRGYQNNGIPYLIKGTTVSAARGNQGAAINSEISLKGIFTTRKKLSFLTIDPYLFGDAGLIGFNINEKQYYTGLIADAGIGLNWQFSNWNKLIRSKKYLLNTQSIVIRTDFPIFLSNIGNGDSHFKFRWMLGVGVGI